MTAPATAAAPSVTKRAIVGVAWILPLSLGARLLGLVGTLVLARWIAPAEYGEVSAAAIVALTAMNVSAFGVGVYFVATRDLTREEAFHATAWYLTTGVAAIVGVAALAGPLGRWFEVPSLGRFLPVFLAGMALDRVGYLPERVLVRALRYRWLSVARAASELAFTAVSLALASLGGGAMSIAWGSLARSGVRFIAIVPAVGWREWIEPHRLRFATTRRIVGYGLNVALTSVAEFAMRRWDNLIVSRLFGPAAMGAYNYAYNLADLPAVAVGEQLTDVAFASFPQVPPERRPRALVRAVTMVSFVMLPLAVGLGTVAPTLVATFFKEKWESVGTMLVFLSAMSAVKPVMGMVNSYLYASERPRVVLYLHWVGFAALVVGMITLGRLGTSWTCATVSAVFAVHTLIGLWIAKLVSGTPLSAYLVPLVRPLLVCAGMVAAILLLRQALGGWPPGARLCAEVALGAAVFLAGAFVVFRSATLEVIELVRGALRRR
jgi:PST family polysaccharide transporter